MSLSLVVLSPRRRARSAFVSIAVLALALTSCSRQAPTALDPRQIPEAGSVVGAPAFATPTRAASSTLGDIENQVVVVLAPDSDPAEVGREMGVKLLDVQMGFALYERPTGDPIDVSIKTKNDRRVLATDDNELALPAEGRQKSWSFDDGYGTLRACRDQLSAFRTGLSTAQQTSLGQNIVVAILDTGVDPTHPLLSGRIAGGWDFIDNDSDPTDVANGIDDDADGVVDGAYGHGTHVAGIVALTAPMSRLLILRVLDADGRGDVKTVAAGIRWATQHGARVINLSLGMMKNSNAVSIALLEAQLAGAVCVAAAGNGGAEFPQQYPAASSLAMAVAASDANDQLAPFTSYGTFVDLSAPGVSIRSAYPGGEYRLWSGTSMAAPFVSGTAALLLSLHPSWRQVDVSERLRGAARALTGIPPGMVGKVGAGALDARAALGPDRVGTGFEDRKIAPGGTIDSQ